MRNLTANGTMYGQTVVLVQISKAAARKLFAEGKEVYLQSCNMRAINPWQSACPISIDSLNTDEATKQFDQHCNSFAYYNLDSERGKYITYYKNVYEAK